VEGGDAAGHDDIGHVGPVGIEEGGGRGAHER
jgi:hypothetical protein